MNIKKIVFFGFLVVFMYGCGNDTSTDNSNTGAGNTLTAFSLGSNSGALDVNSSTIEAVWANATALTVSVSPIGESFVGDPGSFNVSLKAVTTTQDIYFLSEYEDATDNTLRQPLKYNGGTVTDPTKWSHEVDSYDDGFSLVFQHTPGTSGAKTFSSDGCQMLCHTAKTAQWDPGMFSESAGRYDMWYWNAGKSNGCGVADDKICIGSPNFEMQKDDINEENYLYNVIDFAPGFTPYLVAGASNLGLDKKYFIAQSDSKDFLASTSKNPATGSAWKSGDLVPSYYLSSTNPHNSGDYFDVAAKGYRSGSKWIVKFQRKLNTGSAELDIPFTLGNEYFFSFAVHNNNKPSNHYGAATKMFKLKL